MVLALGTVRQASVLEEANNSVTVILCLSSGLCTEPDFVSVGEMRNTCYCHYLERAPASTVPDLPRKGGPRRLLFYSCPQDALNSQAQG